ncbi:MAG: stage IV sporulation protein FB [Parachlamydiaceae bacterium]|nr:stage IV sporulation protein FB [Parachlamydiaceae bacterium]
MLTIPGKIPIRIYPLFLIVMIGISLLNSGFQLYLASLWAIVICVSLLVHEYGHALTAMFFGQRATIELVGFGGVTRRHGHAPTALQEFFIVLNGPLAGIALCGLSYFLSLHAESWPLMVQQLLLISTYANAFWTVLNLLPVQPLDGGQLLRIILQGFFGLKGLKTALFLSFVISFLLAVLFFIYHQVLIGSFFLLFTFEGYRTWKNSLPMTSQDDDKALQQFLKSAEKDYRKGQLGYAQQKLIAVRKHAASGVIHTSATLLLAQIYHAQGHNSEAYNLLLPLRDTLTPDLLLLLHQLAYAEKQWKTAIDIGAALYQHQPTYDVALTNALSHAQLGEAKPSVGWLQCAIKNGLPNFKEILSMEAFNPIRQDPLFENLRLG